MTRLTAWSRQANARRSVAGSGTSTAAVVIAPEPGAAFRTTHSDTDAEIDATLDNPTGTLPEIRSIQRRGGGSGYELESFFEGAVEVKCNRRGLYDSGRGSFHA